MRKNKKSKRGIFWCHIHYHSKGAEVTLKIPKRTIFSCSKTVHVVELGEKIPDEQDLQLF
jgi:hypothetical protein